MHENVRYKFLQGDSGFVYSEENAISELLSETLAQQGAKKLTSGWWFGKKVGRTVCLSLKKRAKVRVRMEGKRASQATDTTYSLQILSTLLESQTQTLPILKTHPFLTYLCMSLL